MTEFNYAIYIKSTPETVWQAITVLEITKQFWGHSNNISSWKKGSQWQHVAIDSTL